MSAPRLAIIMPVLNEAATLPRALARLQPLRGNGVRVIVADGGSGDGSAEAARAAVDALVVVTPPGRARQMNAGAAAALGATRTRDLALTIDAAAAIDAAPIDALVFLHADTALPEGAERAIAQALARRAWGRFDVRIDDGDDGRSSVPLLRIVAVLMNLRSRLTGIATGDQAMFVRRDAFEAIGGFPDQPLMEDVELSARLKRRFGRPACLRGPAVTSGRRWRQRGAWRTIVLMWRLRLAYWLGEPAETLARRYR